METVFSTDPDIVITETEYEESELTVYHVFVDGVQAGVTTNYGEAVELAQEVFAATVGEPQEEEGI